MNTIRGKKADCIYHILRSNCLLKHVTEEKIERMIDVTVRQIRRRKQLLDGLKETIGYCKLKEETPDRSVENRFGRGYGPRECSLYECLSLVNWRNNDQH
jgi:hypothetical protein